MTPKGGRFFRTYQNPLGVLEYLAKMPATMSQRRKPRKTQSEPDQDAEFLRTLFLAIIAGSGRGALSWLSKACGAVTVSHFRKRLRAKNAFDATTMRAILLAQELKADEGEALTDENKVGNLVIGWRADDRLAWRFEES